MRPSLTTLAGMALAAGSIAAVGAGLATGSPASAQSETSLDRGVRTTVFADPVDGLPLDLAPLDTAPLHLGPVHGVVTVGAADPADAEVRFVVESHDSAAPDASEPQVPAWLEDGCPPCGMG